MGYTKYYSDKNAKFNSANIFRVVENIDNTMPMEDVVLAMLEEDSVITSTMTLHIPTEIKQSSSLLELGQMNEEQAENAKLTAQEWSHFLEEDYPGWIVQRLYNK
jgi:hypothetical protein